MSMFKKLLMVIAIILLCIILIMVVWVLLAVAFAYIGAIGAAAAMASAFTATFGCLGVSLAVGATLGLSLTCTTLFLCCVGGALLVSAYVVLSGQSAGAAKYPVVNDTITPIDPEDATEIDPDPNTAVDGTITVRRVRVRASAQDTDVLGHIGPYEVDDQVTAPMTPVDGYNARCLVLADTDGTLEIRLQALYARIRAGQSMTGPGVVNNTEFVYTGSEQATMAMVYSQINMSVEPIGPEPVLPTNSKTWLVLAAVAVGVVALASTSNSRPSQAITKAQ